MQSTKLKNKLLDMKYKWLILCNIYDHESKKGNK